MKTQLNTQPTEKQDIREDGVLDVVDVFYTIQGEGPFAGRPAVFVRLAGCNLQCPSCDTDYTSKRKMYAPKELLAKVLSIGDRGQFHPRNRCLVVLTGGEPFRQNFAEFARRTVYSDFDVQVETNGTLWFDEFFPSRYSVVCSPKMPAINGKLRPYIKTLKYVVRAGEIDPSDGLQTSVLENGLRPCRPWSTYDGEVYIQPMDEGGHPDSTKNRANIQAAVESSMKFGHRLSLQTHKLLGLP